MRKDPALYLMALLIVLWMVVVYIRSRFSMPYELWWFIGIGVAAVLMFFAGYACGKIRPRK